MRYQSHKEEEGWRGWAVGNSEQYHHRNYRHFRLFKRSAWVFSIDGRGGESGDAWSTREIDNKIGEDHRIDWQISFPLIINSEGRVTIVLSVWMIVVTRPARAEP